MTTEQQVADLTTATTKLLDAVNVSKQTLDQKVNKSGESAAAAAASADASAKSATASADSAAKALGIYGSTDAMNAAVAAAKGYQDAATAQAAQAKAQADSALTSAANARAVSQGDSTGLPAIRPSLLLDFANSKVLDPRISHNRSSTGVFYDGKTTIIAEQNQLLWSADLTNPAMQVRTDAITQTVSAVPTPSDVDGVAFATLLTAKTGAGPHAFSLPGLSSGQVYMGSVYVKAGTHRYVGIGSNNSAGIGVVDLETGKAVLGSPVIEVLPDFWYRISGLFTAGGGAGLYIVMTDANGSHDWMANGTETLFVCAPQCEQSIFLTRFTSTTDKPVVKRIPKLMTAPSGVARFHHDPFTGESCGLMFEQQSTNIIINSCEFKKWSAINPIFSSVNIIAPDGTAANVVMNARGKPSYLSQVVPLDKSKYYTYSVFIHPLLSANKKVFFEVDVGGYVVGSFDLETLKASCSSGNAYIVQWPGGWMRLVWTFKSSDVGYSSFNCMYLGAYGSTTETCKLGFWCSQLEPGINATSPIKTQATQVTRNGDFGVLASGEWTNSTDNTLVIEMKAIQKTRSDGGPQIVVSGNRGRAEYVTIRSENLVGTWDASTEVNVANKSVDTIRGCKFSISWGQDEKSMSLSGSPVVTGKSNSTFAQAAGVVLGGIPGLSLANVYIKRISVYQKRLADTEHQAITN